MALEPGTWSGLKNQAQAGYLKFDTTDALAAARACADLVDDLLGMAEAATNLRLDNFAPIGTLTSGTQLAMAFTAKGNRLRTILKDHADIVTDMGETYIAAGKAYANAEGESESDFKALDGLKMPTEASPYTPGARKPGGPDAEFDKASGGFAWKGKDGKPHVSNANAESFPASLKDYQGEKDPGVTASVENKDSLAFSELYELGRDLDPAPVLAAASTWHSMANDLLGKLNTFVNAINTGTEAWEGQGATAAAAAIKNYSDGVQPLATSMIAMSQNLDYSAQWLHLTRLSMPSSPDPGDCCPGKVTRRYRDEWQKHYGEGMKNTVSVMPAVNGPIAQPAPQGGQGQNQPGNDQQGNGQYGNGNGQYGNNQDGYGNQQPDPRYQPGYGQVDPASQSGYGTPDSGTSPRTDGTGSGGTGSGAGAPLPNGAKGGGGSGEGSRSQGQLPPGYEAAHRKAESAAAGARGAATPVGSSGAGSPDGAGTQSRPSSSGNPFPRSSLPGESADSPSGGSGTSMPSVPSLGSAPLPNGAAGRSSGSGGTGSGSSGAGAGRSGASGLEDALAKATGADPAQVRSMLGDLPKLLNENTLAKKSGLSPEQVRSVLKNIPKVADVGELAKLTGLDPAQVRSVLDNLPDALDEKALAAATGTSDHSSSRAGLPGQSSVAGLPGQPTGADGGPASFAQAGRDFLGQIGKALTQGLESLGQLGATLPGADQLHEMLRRFDPAALAAAVGDLPVDPASGAGGGGAGSGGVGSPAGLSEHSYQQARAFPRASLPGAEHPLYPATAAASQGAHGMGGPPMMGPAGAPAGGGAQGDTAQKPAKYLKSKAHLNDAIGAVPDRVKPVIDS
ncbi:PPE domain-containing protein [Nocardia lijiangensis]|uniref:PPE domain-containing protein n=1 Tax=Nocardia lijiangensis TaxID=299618 RepID=UPI000831F9DE|nr:PPE domain-containing protein [Nocardia lijiangensis]